PGSPRARPARRGVSARRGDRRGARLPRRPALPSARRGAAHARRPQRLVTQPMRVAVVAEFYPRAADRVLGVWAHRQAVAARDAGAEVRVLVLHRPVPPRAALGEGGAAAAVRALWRALRQPLHARLDGIEVVYVPFLAPPRPRCYGSWGA